MSHWLPGVVCLVGLVGFIGFAFRQGMKVAPDRNSSNLGPTRNVSFDDGSPHGGFHGH